MRVESPVGELGKQTIPPPFQRGFCKGKDTGKQTTDCLLDRVRRDS